jgi:hypothetical protein
VLCAVLRRSQEGELGITRSRLSTLLSPTRVAPALKAVIESYAAKSGVVLKPQYDAENLSSVLSLATSTGGVTLLPLFCPCVN